MGGLSAFTKEDSPLARFSKMRIIGQSWAEAHLNPSHHLQRLRQFAQTQRLENKHPLPLAVARVCAKRSTPILSRQNPLWAALAS